MSRANNHDAQVLDACCGSRMFWFDKADTRALFLDKRREVCIDPRAIEIVWFGPDILADFAALPFGDETFALVVFDPPHTFNGVNSAMAKKYGRLDDRLGTRVGHRQERFTGGLSASCARNALGFEWNEHRAAHDERPCTDA
ncbi:MAG: SAM-dependent methyltransferase [Sphingobium sp.]|nr:SAM-dependent methyltransferase [Sphingobium sp.]